jgi:NAD(P)-dependent dehydrogenase (short-subunit alcohol dehydrogenase family)
MSQRTAVVVGGASGIGKAVARALATDSCRVIVADRNADGAHSVATELGDPHMKRYPDLMGHVMKLAAQ